MPDWAMILVKCVLWFILLYNGYAAVAHLLPWGRRDWQAQPFRWALAIAIIAGIGLAALEGWITP